MDWGSGHIERNHEGPVIRADDARANNLTDNIHRFKELVVFKPDGDDPEEPDIRAAHAVSGSDSTDTNGSTK